MVKIKVRVPLPDDQMLVLAIAINAIIRHKPMPTFLTYSGSGVVLGNGRVITANHVVDEGIILSIIGETEHGKKFGCKVVRKDADRDLALLQCDGAINLPSVSSFASVSLPLGSRLLTAGYAGGRGLIFTDGILANRELEKGKLLVSALSGPGMSGGAVFTYDGALVGLIQAGYVEPPFTMVSTNSLQLQRFLWKVKHDSPRRDDAFTVQHSDNTTTTLDCTLQASLDRRSDGCGVQIDY